MYKLEKTGRFRKIWHLSAHDVLSPQDFADIATKLKVVPVLAEKVGFVAARRAEFAERIETFTDGLETSSTSHPGDWIVTNLTPDAEPVRDSAGRVNRYVIANESFQKLYKAEGRQSKFGPLFVATGTVHALELPGTFDILAPWRERQKAKAGYLIQNGQEIYGIEKSVFHRTYDFRGPGALRLLRPGKKRMLALDGGGVRGMLTLGILMQLEDRLRKQHSNPNMVLADYFDMIGGTSAGAILATQLALGDEVEAVTSLFREMSPAIFTAPAFWRQPQRLIPFLGPLLVPQFDVRYLEKRLKKKLGDLRLGSPELKTGLCIVTKRIDTGSPWVLTNNPRSKFWFAKMDRMVANKEYRLVDVVRASAAAPHFFKPHKIKISMDDKEKPGVFVDGGVSPFNNPALQLMMLAGLKGYGLEWPMGEENLFIVSVGTGGYRLRSTGKGISARQAVSALSGMIGDGEALTLTLMQWMSASANPWKINSEIDDLSDHFLGQGQGLTKPLLRFKRYDAPLEPDWLKSQLNLEYSVEELNSLRDFTNPSNIDELFKIGSAAAATQVQIGHFPDDFRIDAQAS